MQQPEQNNKPKILILPEPEGKKDTLLVIDALVQIFSNTHDIEILTGKEINSKLNNLLKNTTAKTINQLPEQKFLLQFTDQKGKIQSIQWNQTEEDVNLYITMDEGEFNSENIQIQKAGGKYEKIFTINLPKITNSGINPKDNQHVFENTQIEGFGTPNDIANNWMKENSIGAPQDIFNYLKENNIELNPNAATSILAGLHFLTKNYTENIQSSEIFEISAELMKKEIDIKKVIEKMNSI